MIFGSLSRLIAVRRLATMGPKKASGKAGKGKGSQSAKRERSNSPSDSAESSKKPRSGSRSPSPGSSRRGTKKFCTWNVNGVRAWIQKKGDSFIDKESPDVLCLQETKCSENSLPKAIKEVDGYYCYWLSGDKDGYSGVGLLTKEEPIEVTYGIGVEKHDKEGRVITAEYNKYYLIAAYVPNAGRGLVRLNYRMEWDKDFRKYLQKLDKVKPVILCGDLNVAHQEIDIHNPKTNKRNAGFTQEERDGFSDLLSTGFVDTFRHLYPDVTGAYTFWTYMFNARAKNVGWRLDYFVLSERLIPKVSDCIINDNVQGSDHCPVTLLINV